MMPKRTRARCSRCKRVMWRDQLVDWIDELDDLSPKFCPRCYSYVLDHWEEGDDVESMGDD